MLTHSGDYFTVERVAEALARRGARPFRLNTDLFPEELRISSGLGNRGTDYTVEAGGERLRAVEVRAVWARKLWMPRLDERLDEQLRAMCARESVAALEGFLDGLHDALWVNQPAREREAENKLLQLRLASEVGLRIPRTLVTNDPARAQKFYKELGGSMVAKLLRPLSVSMNDAPFFVYTNEVTARDLEDAETLRHCPMVFQERVPKERELRVAYVGGELFTGAIDAAASARGATDWRRAEVGEVSWEHSEVPREVADALDALMTRLGLAYGAVDLIQTPSGEHVFLEVNPGGEWGMLERDLGLLISEAIADVLLGLAPHR
ncbi:MAG TPA: MvdC family ATP-grasp ribosomal peptide maturase [Pyrinomonadaceae bacterium]|nr:MvdC family ATP-grasp ribosomal peptide maturase [Pyrinomonadaceae bacterium]